MHWDGFNIILGKKKATDKMVVAKRDLKSATDILA